MKQRKIITGLMLATLSSATLHAAPVDLSKQIANQWNVGLGFGLFNPDDDRTFAQPDVGFESGNLWQLSTGYRYSQPWEVRFSIQDMELDVKGTDNAQDAGMYGIDALRFLNNGPLYLVGGLHHIDVDYATRNVSDTAAKLGAGMRAKLNDHFSYQLEAGLLKEIGGGSSDVQLVASVLYHFGGNAKKPIIRPTKPDHRNEIVKKADSDRDGVLDENDKCPDTPWGETVNSFGCKLRGAANQPLDTDRDGVADQDDQCPDTPKTELVDGKGCTVYQDVPVRFKVKVLFETESDVVRPQFRDEVAEVAAFMKKFPEEKVEIEGHASAPGKEDYNQNLSERRAKNVAQILIEDYQIDASRVTWKGYGETQLLKEGNTEAAHRANRRIEARMTATKREKVLRPNK
ncbi:OmpA family protein [Flocculibacter collagenilyticus]|uniref:OmpA family protein n=1 Tax=Flocculibacter collagenilyticus TaxID=2744479 RepID=UPI0018F33C1B|nr:OmpA family protein [Flocculibacter collagenilyticus]